MTFNDLQLTEPLQKAVQKAGYETPTPIQARSIPAILEGRDILGCAQTGTGKTAAFSIPTIQLLNNSNRNSRKPAIKSLILTPTRELAIQIGESIREYGQYSDLKHLVIFGGVPQHSQVQALRNGIDILVATPGRLLDLIDQGYISLSQIEIFTLDEADRMLDMGFVHDVKKSDQKIPQKRQTLFFSATMPDAILDLANSILSNPLKVEVTPVSSTAELIQQELYFIDKSNKKSLLTDILKDSDADRVLVFTRTKHGANKVVKDLIKEGIKSEAIHGNKTQNARQKALKNFKDKTTRVLVATDIAARGIDIDELSLVINYEIPNIAETYVHRIGRTGRAGASGKAISFSDYEEKAYIKDIQKLIEQKIPVVENHDYPMELFEVPEKNLSKEDRLEISTGVRVHLQKATVQEILQIEKDIKEQSINKGHSENYFGDYRDFWWNKAFLDMTAQRLDLGKHHSMLDVGCGYGHWTRILSPYLNENAAITAVDSDPKWYRENSELSEFFSEKNQSFKLEKGDALNLPFPNDSFDLVTCQTVLIHIPNPKKAIQEMKRVLKPGGTLLCVEPNNIIQSLIKTSLTKHESIEETLDHIKYRLIIEAGKREMGQGDNSLGDLLPGMFAMEDIKNIEVRLSDKAIAMFPPYDNDEQVATLEQWIKGSSWNSKTQKDIDYFSAAGEQYMPFYFEYQEKYTNQDAHIMGALQREQYHASGASLMYLVSGTK